MSVVCEEYLRCACGLDTLIVWFSGGVLGFVGECMSVFVPIIDWILVPSSHEFDAVSVPASCTLIVKQPYELSWPFNMS